MSLSDLYKNKKNREMDYFFGKDNWNFRTNKYFEFKRVLNEDEFIIVTNNVRKFKNNAVLMVSNKHVVYLQDWAIREVYNVNYGYSYVIKLNRKYFKTYEWKNEFIDVYFEKEETFDDLLNIAKLQEKDNLEWSFKKGSYSGKDLWTNLQYLSW